MRHSGSRSVPSGAVRVTICSLAFFCALTADGFGQAEPSFSGRWSDEYGAAVAALSEARYEDARRLFESAIAIAESLGPPSQRLAESLSGLAQVHGLSGDYEGAVPLFVRSVGILEKLLPADDPNLAIHRNNLAATLSLLGEYGRAEPLYLQALAPLEKRFGARHPDVVRSLRGLAEAALHQGHYTESARYSRRLLEARWGSLPEDGRPGIVPVLEDLAGVLSLAYFSDEELLQALERFHETLVRSRVEEDVYRIMSDLLLDYRLRGEAEQMMLRAVEEFPESRQTRIALAELYSRLRRPQAAVSVLVDALPLPPRAELSLSEDSLERSRIETRIGELQVGLGHFDAAIAALDRALQLEPGSVDARLALAGLDLGRNRLEDAYKEYNEVIQGGHGVANAFYGLAEVEFYEGRFPEAAAAALEALAVDPGHPTARYTRARALLRAGDTQAGRRELDVYQAEAARRLAETSGGAQLSAVYRAAAAALLNQQPDETMRLLLEGIETHPDAAGLYFNLGIVQRKLGGSDAAIRTWQRMLDLGCCQSGDSFLVHRNLALEYEKLGEEESAARHWAVYLREFDVALAAARDRALNR